MVFHVMKSGKNMEPEISGKIIFIDNQNRKGAGMEDLLKVGVITSTHGIRGEVKVYPTTDDLQRFTYLKDCILDTGAKKLPMEVEGCKFFKNQAILKFKGYDNINDIEKYKNASLWVTRENAVPLEEGEFYIADILKAKVYEENGRYLGILTDVMETGANDVYVVELETGKELLIPAIPQCITDINVEEPRLTVRLMKGMLEED